ncbi:hypothetical protein IKG31_00105 [Candidatus Saccharibacteria bacterium]|nr:hypothetical protein [Candidatus Saccharibacteria bacterium]
MTKVININPSNRLRRRSRSSNIATTAHNFTSSASIVEPANSTLKPTWEDQNSPKLSQNWPRIILICFGIMIVVIVIILVVNLIARPDSQTSSKENPQDASIDPNTITDDNPLDEVADLNRFFAALTDDPDFNYEFTASETRYSNLPSTFSCNDIKSIAFMNPKILNLYLDNGSVVIISGKWNNPSGEISTAFMIYGGSLVDSTYNTAKIYCPSSSDEILNRTGASTSIYASYSSSDIFDNLSSDAHFYVWTDPATIGTGE